MMHTRLRWIAEHLEEVLGASLLAGMACLAFANVVTRYIFEYPLAFTEELEINALVWLTLFGTSSAFRRRRHLRMLFFQEKLPRSVRRRLNFVIGLAGASLFAFLGYLGYKQLLDERLLEITSESLGLPQWWYTACIPIGCSLIVYRIVVAAVADFREQK
ncbi:TRAP transporter small permease [Desulfogranum marinum]|uniref:TRAP transporter small permease n=1 Tax=Desulfogranum marinum TaxID=453220 RepID=UPI001964679D|nr:TRAP transporter small permease [Desulfogranum marinum]MBM9512067.1 TRAP transporter small permease [Desulfogranum marinum]